MKRSLQALDVLFSDRELFHPGALSSRWASGWRCPIRVNATPSPETAWSSSAAGAADQVTAWVLEMSASATVLNWQQGDRFEIGPEIFGCKAHPSAIASGWFGPAELCHVA